MTSFRTTLAALVLALTTEFTAGCERVIFAVANRGVPPPEVSVVYAADRGLSLDVYRPEPGPLGNDRRAVPVVVVFFYGGGWSRGERAQYAFVGHRLAQQGVLAIVADYRTYPRAGFPDFVDDAALAVAWAKHHAADYQGDPRRLYVAGHSAGAQIAALLGTDRRYLAKVDLRPRDLAGVIGLSGPYDFVINGRYTRIFGPPAQWPRAQAVNFVDGDEPPFLLVHGDKDRVVETRDSVELADKLRAHKVAATLLIVPGGSHDAPLMGLYDPKRQPTVLPAIVKFIQAPVTEPTR